MYSIVLSIFCFSRAATSITAETSYDDFSDSFIFQNKCITDLDCFYNGPPFYHPLFRPITVTPKENITAQYLVFTRSNSEIAHKINLTEASVAESPIDSKWLTKILVHGFVTKLEENDTRYRLKNELLEYGSYNVIIIDWTEHNGRPYVQAIANARVIGAKIAKLIKICEKVKNVKQEDIHIIGHSLGAHIAGWAGERLESLGRISGLDPAGPFFHNAPPTVKLDWTDATFVDVIHTNGGLNALDGLGLDIAIGHLDFYPNGGKNQPGCRYNFEITQNSSDNLDYLVANSCDHSRVFEYYISSISKCSYVGVLCSNYRAFKRGKCMIDPTTAVMGFHATKVELPEASIFYLDTYNTSPFCMKNDTVEKYY